MLRRRNSLLSTDLLLYFWFVNHQNGRHPENCRWKTGGRENHSQRQWPGCPARDGAPDSRAKK